VFVTSSPEDVGTSPEGDKVPLRPEILPGGVGIGVAGADYRVDQQAVVPSIARLHSRTERG
jgi:hypothetical protein